MARAQAARLDPPQILQTRQPSGLLCRCAFHKLDSNERVVKSTQVRHPRDRSGLLDETAKRGILVQRKVRARLIVIASVRSKNAS
jgi:hypothetical protein